MRRLLIAFSAVLLIGADRAPGAEDLGWMAGDRTHTGTGSTVREVWIGPEGGVLVGMSLTARPGRPARWEHMRIGALPDGRLAFFADPGGQSHTVFPLKSLEGGRVVFENLDHDFPQRVIYWDKGADAVGARIEGVAGGQERFAEWEFRPRAPD